MQYHFNKCILKEYTKIKALTIFSDFNLKSSKIRYKITFKNMKYMYISSEITCKNLKINLSFSNVIAPNRAYIFQQQNLFI